MANPKKRVPENIPGDFFVDSTCIDCDACRQIAPSVFADPLRHDRTNREAASEAGHGEGGGKDEEEISGLKQAKGVKMKIEIIGEPIPFHLHGISGVVENE